MSKGWILLKLDLTLVKHLRPSISNVSEYYRCTIKFILTNEGKYTDDDGCNGSTRDANTTTRGQHSGTLTTCPAKPSLITHTSPHVVTNHTITMITAGDGAICYWEAHTIYYLLAWRTAVKTEKIVKHLTRRGTIDWNSPLDDF